MRTIIALCLFLTACVTAKTEFLTPTRYAPISMDSVTIFMGAAELQADSIAYERVAMIFLKGSQTFTDQQAMIRKAREEAGKMGCNGIVVSTMVEGGYNRFWGTENPRQGTVIAIRWWVKKSEP